jgi:putative ABC transport system substrate-binding protein
MPVIGFLNIGTLDKQREANIAAFHLDLAELGYFQGRNVAVEYRWTDGHNDRLPSQAAELVRRQVAVIVTTGGSAAAFAAKAATQTVPVIFEVGTDPIETGLVASLNRPGGNLTGAATLILELLHELVPTAASVALLTNPDNPIGSQAEAKEIQAAAGVLGVSLLVLNASSPGDLDTAFANMVERGVGALVVSSDVNFRGWSEQIIALTARHAMPATYMWREQAAAGGA